MKNLFPLPEKTNSRALALLFSLFSVTNYVSAESTEVNTGKNINTESEAATITSPADSDAVLIMPALKITTTHSGSAKIDNTSAEGSYILDEEAIKHYGSSSGSMTEILKTIPNVQFSDDANSADSMSSLKPASVSISGGRYYDNNFSINGISNNSLLDPANSSTGDSAINDVPGHEQAIFLDLSQVGSLKVYDSNVPVEYGRFTGGVVDARIRRPDYTPHSELSYYTTRSEWVKYRIIINEFDDEDALYEAPEEPEFSRQRFTASHERGISDNQSLRLNISANRSSTPILNYHSTEQITEESLNLTLTHGYEGDNLSAVSFITYSPYHKDTLLEDVKDGDFTLSGGGLAANSDLSFHSGSLDHALTLAASYSVNSRSAPTHYFNWANTNSRHWGIEAGEASSEQGGYGDLDKFQSSLALNWKATMPLRHPLLTQLLFGSTVTQSSAGFDRPRDTYIYGEAVINTAVQCVNQTLDCVQKEQYFRERLIYPEDKVSVSLTELALFSEMTLHWKNLETTAGLRLDYDNFLERTNIAWRSRAAYDIRGDQTALITAGVNRYYGGPLLTYKLREAARPYYQEYRGTTLNIVNDWEYNTGTGDYRYVFDDVRTPYSDEWTLGFKTLLFGGTGEIKSVNRNNEDEFARKVTDIQPDGYKYYRVTNEGFTDYQSFSVSWDRSNDRSNYGFVITWSETKSSNDTYDDSIDAASSSTNNVWYQGSRRTLSDIAQLRENYARPLVATLYSHFPLGERINTTLQARYKSSYKTITQGTGSTYDNVTGSDGVSYGQYLNNYVDSTKPATLIFDTRLSVQAVARPSLTLVAEIKNLFNVRTHTVEESDDDGVEVGRTLWLGAEASF